MKTTGFIEVPLINPDSVGAKDALTHIFYVDISAVGEGWLDSDIKEIAFADAPSRAKRRIRRHDIVLSTVRPNRRSMFFATQMQMNWIVSTGFAVIRAKENLVDARFLYSYVFDRRFTEYLTTVEKGAAYPAVSAEDIGAAEISLPPLATQRAIAQVLGALDDKIALNRRMNATLEGMARALFKDWFVDFGPVRAKMAGSTPTLDADLWDLFPSDIGADGVPVGWTRKQVRDIGTIICGKTPATKQLEFYGGTTPFITIPDMHGKIFAMQTAKNLTDAGINSQKNKLLPIHSLCVSCIASPGLVGRIQL